MPEPVRLATLRADISNEERPMPYMIYCIDKPEHGDVRAAARKDHLAYLTGFKDKVLMAGPTTTDDASGMTGSLLLMDFADRAEAEAFAAGDPYAKAGLFAETRIHAWKKVLP